MKFTEDELLEIGFSKQFIGQTDDNGNEIYFLEWSSGYFEYDLVTNGSDDNGGEDEWQVYIAEPVSTPFQTVTDIIKWIELIEKYK